MTKAQLDPVTSELIRCRLVAGAEQMSMVLWKSAFSTVIREVLDYSTAIFDAQGRMVAQSTQLPFQMMTMSAPLQALLGRDDPWEEGDVVLLNDPYACLAQHLPDFMVFRPIHVAGDLIGFAGAVAHMLDVGGGAPGSYLATATEIFQEGLRLPPVKIVRGGRRNQELFDLIALNVREPEKVIGDVTAMIACTEIGGAVVTELVKRYDFDTVRSAMQHFLRTTAAQLRRRIADLPDGCYRGVDHVDDDGITDEPIRLELRLKIAGECVSADFTGSSPQARGPVNATLEMTRTTVIYCLMATIGEGVAKNDGFREVVEVYAPPRSVLHAQSPAPLASRVTTCHRVVDVMMQALGQVMPQRVMAGYYGVSNICNLGGLNPQTHRPWVHFEIEVGGWGARPQSDGLDGFSAHIHNLANTPVEVVEASVPLRVERYQFIADSGGGGRFRGGLGLRRDIRVLQDGVSLNLLGDHCKFPPRGLGGGGDGAPGRYVLNPGTPHERVMPNKLSNFPLRAGDVICMQTPGGGGYGDPRQRASDASERDRREGKTTT